MPLPSGQSNLTLIMTATIENLEAAREINHSIITDGTNFLGPFSFSYGEGKTFMVRTSYKKTIENYRLVWVTNEIMGGKDIRASAIPCISRSDAND